VSPVEVGLLSQFGLGVLAVALAVITPDDVRSRFGGVTCAAVALAGVVTGGFALAGARGELVIATVLPGMPLTLGPDRLGGLFILVASVVGLLVSVYGLGYATGPAASRTAWASLAVFLLAMQLVPAASDALSFLAAWETMALASTVLLLAEQAKRSQVRTAGLWYSVMTHLSFVLLLAGFAVVATQGGGIGFAQMATVDPGSGAASVAFLLLVLGFGSKAGMVPLHVWLPRAHPEAPSHVSAAMSAAMVKMGVYGILLVGVRLLPGGPQWWGAVLLVLGAASALYGILQASVTSDLKRLLAYSTSENVGLMFMALGAGLTLRTSGLAGAADAALVGCLLLVVSHAAFKATMFLGAGAVVHGTGVRDLDQLGGLGPRMPWTAAAFGIGCLGAASLPVTSGFVAEWTLLQALIHGGSPGDRLLAVLMPVSVAVVALTAGLALLTFVKAYGIGFLARPRTPGAAEAHEAAPAMRVALVAGAAGVVLLGVLPGPVAAALSRAVGVGSVHAVGLGGVDLAGVDALLDPLALAGLAAAVAIPVITVATVSARRHPRRHTALAWGCGGARVSPRMQYTATSYAEPLVRVFDDALRPDRDIEVTHATESRYLVERVRFSQRLGDVIEERAYRPVLSWVRWVGRQATRLQNGSVHRYLGYSFAALLAVLVAVSL
jgi:formate hydrogenlyase subunit 3/multisubunit Na+/H+ antiporter MnhD subunit